MAVREDLVEEVHAPNGGVVDSINLDLLSGAQASAMVNMHHDRLGLDRRLGFVQVGPPTPDLICYGGFHYRKKEPSGGYSSGSFLTPDDRVWQILRVQGKYLYKGTGAGWSAAHSNGIAAGAPDIIGNQSGFGSFVQYAGRVYWHDTSERHRYWDGNALHDYGEFAGVELPAGTAAADIPDAGSGSGGENVGALSLSGASSYVAVADAELSGAVAFTISAWVKTSSTSPMCIFEASNDNAGSPSRVALSLNVGGRAVAFELWGGGTFSYRRIFSSVSISDGQWHHVVATRNTGSQMFLYVDGVGIMGADIGLTALSIATAYIGAYRSATTNQNYFAGLIDDVRVYARGLTDTEIAELHRGCPVSAASLVGYWAFEEGTGTSVADQGSGANNGTLTGAGATWSTDTPPVPSTNCGDAAAAAECHLLAGDYSFVYTYYNPSSGEETGPSAVSNVVTFGSAGGHLMATVPANADWLASMGYTTIRFYRTTVDGAAYLFDHEVANVAALPITEELCKRDEDLASEVDYDHGEIPRLRYVIEFAEMIVGAGNPDDPSAFYWSGVGNPSHWPPQNAQSVSRDDGNTITGIFKMFGRVYILKTSGVYMATPNYLGDGTVTFNVEQITSDWGCLSHWSIAVIDTYVYWASSKGICRFNGQQVESVSDPIWRRWKALASAKLAGDGDPVLGNLPPPVLECYGIHDRQPDHNYYRLTMLDAEDSYHAHDLVYDIAKGCWFEDVGADTLAGWWNRVSWPVMDKTGQFSVFQADSWGRAYRLRTDMAGNAVYTDAGWPIYSRWKSKHWGGMDGIVPLYIEIEYERSAVGETSGPVTVNLYADGQTTPRVIDTTSIVLYDVNSPVPAPADSTLPDPTRASHVVQIPWTAEWCRRFCFELVVNQTDCDFKVLWYRVVADGLAPMRKAR
jgi:hypothetical protein